MDTEKTTLLSVIVGIAGLLVEFIFHDTLMGSVIGVVLSVILALIILCCTYFAVDGIKNSISAARKREENRKREYDEKLYRLLNKKLSEQVKLQKGIYGALITLQQKKGSLQKDSQKDDQKGNWTELAESINDNALNAAKIIVKYNQKNQKEADHVIETSTEEILQAIGQMDEQLQQLSREMKQIASEAVSHEREIFDLLQSVSKEIPEDNLPEDGEATETVLEGDQNEMPVEPLMEEGQGDLSAEIPGDEESLIEKDVLEDIVIPLPESMVADTVQQEEPEENAAGLTALDMLLHKQHI
ncbi:MAG: hypothetical protein J6K58_10685 [Lachnospiraceae bacterium]|nr:hypothetical protein [Lachnospiraceae bacterium]